MSKAALSLVTLVIALAFQGCMFPYPGSRSDSGVAPREVSSNVTTRAELLEKAPPDLRTPDYRFFVYQNIGSREWKWCDFIPNLYGPSRMGCDPVGTTHWARWVVVEFDEHGVVKAQITDKCENKVCGCPQTALLGVLEGYYSPALATEYGQAFEREDPLYGLHQAVARGDVQQVKSLLAQGANPNARVCDRLPLYSAITDGNVTVATLLLDAGADVNVRDGEDHTALNLAVTQGNTSLVDQLLTHGPNLNATDRKGRTALHLAVSKGNVAVVERLLAGGANVNAKDYEDRTALDLAVSQGKVAVAERLIAGGADVSAMDKNGITPLDLVSQDNTEMIALLRAHRAAEVNEEERRMLGQIVGTWHGDGENYVGHRVGAKYVFKANGAFVYDWVETYGAGHVEQPPGTLHLSGKKLAYKDAEGLLWTFRLDEDKKGRHILHVHSKEGTWTLTH